VTVYVYRYRGQGPTASYRSPSNWTTEAWPHPWFGLTADTEAELHPFAKKLGLNRQLYRPRKAGSKVLPIVGHYDLDEAERDRAVTNGAVTLTTRQHDKMLRRLARDRGIKL
jgi:Protein of unknown function (DUF4031)